MMNRNARTPAVTFHAFCFCRRLSIKPRSTPRVACTLRVVRRAYHITVGVRTIIRTHVSQAAVGTCSQVDVAPMGCRAAIISTCAANGSPNPSKTTRIRCNITGVHLKTSDCRSSSSLSPFTDTNFGQGDFRAAKNAIAGHHKFGVRRQSGILRSVFRRPISIKWCVCAGFIHSRSL